MRSFLLLTVVVLAALATGAAGEDWGAYSFVPASAQDFVLEAVDGGNTDDTAVSINALGGKAHQKWIRLLVEQAPQDHAWVVAIAAHQPLLLAHVLRRRVEVAGLVHHKHPGPISMLLRDTSPAAP